MGRGGGIANFVLMDDGCPQYTSIKSLDICDLIFTSFVLIQRFLETSASALKIVVSSTHPIMWKLFHLVHLKIMIIQRIQMGPSSRSPYEIHSRMTRLSYSLSTSSMSPSCQMHRSSRYLIH